MKYSVVGILGILFLSLVSSCTVRDFTSRSEPISHEIWTELLQKYAGEDGKVNYKGFIEERAKFDQYIKLLSGNHPNKKNWSEEEHLAYWINAYNAYTVQLIIDNYPTNSIKDIKSGIAFINSVWDIKFINIESRTYDLNQIEHGILRKKFNEPRIHFAVNCASVSCPNLRNEAFVAERIDVQLSEQASLFLGDNSKNKILKDKIELSKIFSWFGGDFKKKTSLIQYLNQYASVQISENAEKSFLDYDWNLNE